MNIALLPVVVTLLLTVLVALCLCLKALVPRRIALTDDDEEGDHHQHTSHFSFFSSLFRSSTLLRSTSNNDDYNDYQPDATTLRNTNPYAIATHARSLAFERAHLHNHPSTTDSTGERTRSRGLFSLPRRFGGTDRDSGEGGNGNQYDLTVEQKQVVEEMGVQAWEFVMDFELNCIVQDRTEVVFLEGEGGCLQTNLPLPKQKDIYYWEVKVFEKHPKTVVSVGLATKPYPNFRYPGWNRTSVGYQSDDGRKYVSDAFSGRSYGKPYHQGDVIGIGYRPQSGTVFFTRNGMRLEDAHSGMKQALYPTVAADGPCTFHVNLGQLGFVFIEANVKKWGLAPAEGSQAPPPAYGLAEQHGDLILLEASGSSTFSAPTASGAAASNSSITHSIQHLHSSQPSPLRLLSQQTDIRQYPSSSTDSTPGPSATDTSHTSNPNTSNYNASTSSHNLPSFATSSGPKPATAMHQDDIELEWDEHRRRRGDVLSSRAPPTRVSIATMFSSPPEQSSSSASSSASSFAPPLSSSSSPFISLNVMDAADNRYSHVHTSVGPPPAYSSDPRQPDSQHPSVPVVSPNERRPDGQAWSRIGSVEVNSSDENVETGRAVEGGDR